MTTNNQVSYETEAEINCITSNGDKTVTAEIDNFRFEDSLTAFIAHNKIHMTWTGKVYVGRMAGLEFTTYGPNETRTWNGRR